MKKEALESYARRHIGNYGARHFYSPIWELPATMKEEILNAHKEGVSYNKIRRWLRFVHDIRVSHETVVIFCTGGERYEKRA